MRRLFKRLRKNKTYDLEQSVCNKDEYLVDTFSFHDSEAKTEYLFIRLNDGNIKFTKKVSVGNVIKGIVYNTDKLTVTKDIFLHIKNGGHTLDGEFRLSGEGFYESKDIQIKIVERDR